MRKINIIIKFISVIFLFLVFSSCEQLNIVPPIGKVGIKGEIGDNGLNGYTSYEIWVENVKSGKINWDVNKITEADYFTFLAGEKGKDGIAGSDAQSVFELWQAYISSGDVYNPKNKGVKWPANKNSHRDFFEFLQGSKGSDGDIPYIGSNGNWFVNNEDTGIIAKGEKGDKGENGDFAVAPNITIGSNGNWIINGKDTQISARGIRGEKGDTGDTGDDGKVPTITIGDNGNWFLNGKDTGNKALGTDGKIVEVAIGKNGNWWINGIDTGKPANDQNTDKRSAYNIWKKMIEKGNIPNPKYPQRTWPTDKTSMADYWEFLSGPDAEVLNITIIATPGRPGEKVPIILGKPNVIAQYSYPEYGEYHNSDDGSVKYIVYDLKGKPAPHAKVRGIKGAPSGKEYIANDKGEFIIPKEDLPSIQDIYKRFGSVEEVTLEGETEPLKSAPNTYVPNRIELRFRIGPNHDINNRNYVITNKQYLFFWFERRLNPKDDWFTLPVYLKDKPNRNLNAYEVRDKNNPATLMLDGEHQLISEKYSWTGEEKGYLQLYTYRIWGNNRLNLPLWRNKYVLKKRKYSDNPIYYTIAELDSYYGENVYWNGVAELPVYQFGPHLKKLKLKKISQVTPYSFEAVSGELDFSCMNLSKIVNLDSRFKEGVSYGSGNFEEVYPIYFTNEEAKDINVWGKGLAKVEFSHLTTTSSLVISTADNINPINPTFEGINNVYLNGDIWIKPGIQCFFQEYKYGTLKYDKISNKYYVETEGDLPPVEVEYEN